MKIGDAKRITRLEAYCYYYAKYKLYQMNANGVKGTNV